MIKQNRIAIVGVSLVFLLCWAANGFHTYSAEYWHEEFRYVGQTLDKAAAEFWRTYIHG